MTSLIFSGKVIHLVDEGKAVDIVYLDFDTVSTAFYWINWLLMAWMGTLFIR